MHKTHNRSTINQSPYPGLIFELGPGVAGLALGLCDELLEGQGIVLPQGESHRLQQEQRQLDVLLREGSQQPLEDVEDEERVHHLEVVEVGHHGDQVITLLTLPRLLTVQFVKLAHHRLQKLGPYLL